MADIFLSYARKDGQRVEALRDALTAHGFSVFWDHDVPPASDWDSWIRQRLHESRCAVVIWTVHSVQSKNVRHEAVVALNQNKLISVMLDEVPAHDFPMGLYSVEAVNLSGWSGDTQAKEYKDLVHWLEAHLTPAWITNTLETRDAALLSERNRREAAEGQVRLLQNQAARDAVELQRLEHERDAARAELSAPAVEQPEPKRVAISPLRHYRSALLIALGGALVAILIAVRIGIMPMPFQPSVSAANLSEEDCRTVALERLKKIKYQLSRSDLLITQSAFDEQPPLKDLIVRGWPSRAVNSKTLLELDTLCITNFNDKVGQCNWTVEQQRVLPSLEQNDLYGRTSFADQVIKDLEGQ